MISLAYPSRLLLAVLAYAGLYVLSANVAWMLRTHRLGRLNRVLEFGEHWSSKLWLGDVLRMAYFLVGPYLALSWGWASPLDFGLANLDWIAGLGWTFGLGAMGLFLLVPLWGQYVRLVGGRLHWREANCLDQPHGWAFVLRESIFLETWSALCRSPMLLLAGPYWGVYLGLALASFAALLKRSTIHALSLPGRRESVVLTASLALLNATLYVFAHNLWLCIALHFALRLAILRLVHGGAVRPAFEEQELVV